jgi:hypothetical protein
MMTVEAEVGRETDQVVAMVTVAEVATAIEVAMVTAVVVVAATVEGAEAAVDMVAVCAQKVLVL